MQPSTGNIYIEGQARINEILSKDASWTLLGYNTHTGITTCLAAQTGTTAIRSGATNLLHRKNGTDYVIVDASNYTSYQVNDKVTQTYVNANAGYTNLRPILVGSSSHGSTNSFSTVTDSCIAVGPIYAKPSAGLLYASAFYSTSDIRFKNIEEELIINVKQLSELPLFNFTWNNGIDGKHSGTSAQEVMKILPNLVSGDEMLTLNYATLGTIAGITACKELVTQKSELQQLKEKVKQLEDKLRKYENTL